VLSASGGPLVRTRLVVTFACSCLQLLLQLKLHELSQPGVALVVCRRRCRDASEGGLALASG
jgi:hypothetical protein